MKLSNRRFRKIIKMKNQTRKKKNGKKKRNGKKRSFRRKRYVNLHSQTIKKRGGGPHQSKLRTKGEAVSHPSNKPLEQAMKNVLKATTQERV